MSRPHIQLDDNRWKLWRLSDDEFRALGDYALPILQNYELLVRLKQLPLTLGQALSVLDRRLGPSSSIFDGFRSSFSFPLLLMFGHEQRAHYLLRCHDHRGLLYFPLYRISPVEPSIAERVRFHVPGSGDLPKEEMDSFVTRFHRYLMEQGPMLSSGPLTRYYRFVRSDLIIYGYDGKEFFERHCSDLSEYERARVELDVQLGAKHAALRRGKLMTLIDFVTDAAR